MNPSSKGMTLWGHLKELRKRLFYSMIALIFGVIISVTFGDFLLEFVARPIGGMENLLSIQVTENISVYFRVTMLGGFIIALPFILIQLFLFISPIRYLCIIYTHALRQAESSWM